MRVEALPCGVGSAQPCLKGFPLPLENSLRGNEWGLDWGREGGFERRGAVLFISLPPILRVVDVEHD